MKLFNPDRSTLMEITSLRRDGSDLIVSGNIMGTTSCENHALVNQRLARRQRVQVGHCAGKS
jgi:hypothetical protein